ncbi:MAG: hypothetical protein RLY87_2363 [Chloroflexota bacterium]|jgi:uncharacterized membrane protein
MLLHTQKPNPLAVAYSVFSLFIYPHHERAGYPVCAWLGMQRIGDETSISFPDGPDLHMIFFGAFAAQTVH